uniref:Ig-like domain-containing protein n=1 Tax=Anser cygnoides TaxID=8845 RepID=A0A8B9E3V9_ANSCY
LFTQLSSKALCFVFQTAFLSLFFFPFSIFFFSTRTPVFPSLPFPSLPFPSLPFPSLPFPSVFFPFLEPPSFVKKVDPSYLLTPGDSARLQCKVKGSPEIQVTWFKDNKEIRETNTHKMSFTNSVAVLDILEMKVDDSGSYSCEAVNEVGSDSCTTEVVVKGLFFLLLTNHHLSLKKSKM